MTDIDHDLDRFRPRPVPEGERVFGAYRLLHELGSGGMATLYLATDELGRLVALKRLHRHLVDDPRFLDMFRDEAAISSRINHPGVCKVHAADAIRDRPFIVMEYVHGESLACILAELGRTDERLPDEAVAHLFGQACLGLHAAHEQADAEGRPLQIVHRDISPQNLLVSYDGELKIIDFGIAWAVHRLHRTETGTLKGKLAYMSPEQTRGSDVDRRSDIFSLGIVLYEALCGRRCFADSNPAVTIQRVQQLDYLGPRTARPDLPVALEQVISRAMAARPEDRYPDAAAMYRDIHGYLADVQSQLNAGAVGELMRRIFAPRYAMREELRALAFGAPDVLEEEELTLEQRIAPAARCDYCGAELASQEALAQHREQCGQRRWWERNFGQAGRAPAPATPTRPVPPPPRPGSWLSRLKDRLTGARRDPLTVRLRSIEARLGSVRDHQTSELAWRGMSALWRLVEDLPAGKARRSTDLLARLKPRILRCANALLATALEIEAGAAYLAATGTRDLRSEVDILQRRLEGQLPPDVRHELERNLAGKRALVDERERVAARVEAQTLRLESMVDAFELTLGKVLQITSSPLEGRTEADTQITVFLDSLVLEIDRLARALREVEGTLDAR